MANSGRISERRQQLLTRDPDEATAPDPHVDAQEHAQATLQWVRNERRGSGSLDKAKTYKQGESNVNDWRLQHQAMLHRKYMQPPHPRTQVPDNLVQFSAVMKHLQEGWKSSLNGQRRPEDYMMSGGLPSPYTSGIPNTGGMTPPYIGKGKGRAVDPSTPTPMGFGRPMVTSSDTEKWRKAFNMEIDKTRADLSNGLNTPILTQKTPAKAPVQIKEDILDQKGFFDTAGQAYGRRRNERRTNHHRQHFRGGRTGSTDRP
jgi:hypothetical protein